jgi:hypothetical protein
VCECVSVKFDGKEIRSQAHTQLSPAPLTNQESLPEQVVVPEIIAD